MNVSLALILCVTAPHIIDQYPVFISKAYFHLLRISQVSVSEHRYHIVSVGSSQTLKNL